MVHFFLSHESEDDDQEEIGQFFLNLQSEVAALMAVGKSEAGAMIKQSSQQSPWLPERDTYVATCDCMIAMLTPRYLKSAYCGSEFRGFNNRLVAYNNRVPALIPLWWWLPSDIPTVPDAISTLSFIPTDLPRSYLERGLRELLRNRTRNADYGQVVTTIARHIAKVVSEHPVPPASPPPVLSNLVSPFVPHVPQQRPDEPPAAQAPKLLPAPTTEATPQFSTDANHIFIVVSAASLTEISMTLKRSPHVYYGDSHAAWDPYAPPHVALGAVAGATIEIHRTQDDDESADDHRIWELIDGSQLPAITAWAQQYRQLVVLIIDVWSASLPAHARVLRKYDTLSFRANPVRNDPILAPWSVEDPDTINADVFRDTILAHALPRHHIDRSRAGQTVHLRVDSADDFHRLLLYALGVAEARLLNSTTEVDWDAPSPVPVARLNPP